MRGSARSALSIATGHEAAPIGRDISRGEAGGQAGARRPDQEQDGGSTGISSAVSGLKKAAGACIALARRLRKGNRPQQHEKANTAAA
ncbi:MAG TPA: hypothetical protein PKH44_11885, partial [Plasticicumulans sp.]|nr:hypothetical protein [Plasticicumulans sp.]